MPSPSSGQEKVADSFTLGARDTVEQCINQLKQWRGLATRYDKTATISLGGLNIAAAFIWLAS
ncbi:hypothetical protein SJX93_17275 [Streptomyces cyaneofuscatus]|uniref:hypothetical protein n=1 Tax=Streptomyces cyaneofuscatus TaxID=66883 RepID=UPI002D770109|nr:hypothetical protein [Streptomyces cyaneofuscatus]WRO11256.1 hypothetical protein SJX93_17275 [Streptomyces cyaneofuscatus]